MPGRCSVSRNISLLAALAAGSLGWGIPAHAFAEEAGVAHSYLHAPVEIEPAGSHYHGDLMFFPAVTGTHRNISVPGLRHNEVAPEVNIFYSIDRERLRFLAEFLWNRDEHEMERLQLGWLIHPTATLWLGRFHSPLGFWNSEHHHGAFMQTAITRPGILDFEDEGGVLPTHITGLLAEGTYDRERGAFNYAFSIGRGPELEGELKPVNITEFRDGGDLAVSARLSYRPLDERVGEFGGFAGYARIPVRGLVVGEGEQTVAGVFYNRRSGKLRLIGELFYVGAHLRGPAREEEVSFGAGYLQVEYQAHDDWTVFGRVEDTSNAKNNAYLDQNPEFLYKRTVAGVRFELNNQQALKLETSHNERQDDASFSQVSLQWSMVYP
jgi:hypothetical protein